MTNLKKKKKNRKKNKKGGFVYKKCYVISQCKDNEICCATSKPFGFTYGFGNNLCLKNKDCPPITYKSSRKRNNNKKNIDNSKKNEKSYCIIS